MKAQIHIDMDGRAFSSDTAEQLALMLEEMAKNVRDNASVIDQRWADKPPKHKKWVPFRPEVVHSDKFQAEADALGALGDGMSGELKIFLE